jgi:hypothetical protein
MIFIMGSELQANVVAAQAELSYNEWVRLFWREQLMGYHGPHVVVLDSAPEMEGFHDILDMVFDRSGTVWSAMDLFNRKVPR